MKEVTLEEAKGKTFSRMVFSQVSDQALVVFEDGTFTTLNAVIGADGDDLRITSSSMSLLRFGESELTDAGVYTTEELAQLHAELQARWDADNARWLEDFVRRREARGFEWREQFEQEKLAARAAHAARTSPQPSGTAERKHTPGSRS